MKEKAFSLIEVLVSITILSVVIGIAVYSLKFAINVIDYIKYPSTQEIIKISYLRDSLNSLFFFLEEDTKTKSPKQKFKFFFYGEERSLIYVSTKPIVKKRGNLFIQYIYFKDSNLYLKEFPLYHPRIDYKKPRIPKEATEVLLLRDISNFKISYLLERWNNTVKNQIPKLIKMSYTNKRGKKLELFFKPQSDFYFKKEINVYLYSPM